LLYSFVTKGKLPISSHGVIPTDVFSICQVGPLATVARIAI